MIGAYRYFLLNCCVNLTFLLCGEPHNVLCYDSIHDHILFFPRWTAHALIYCIE